MKLPPVTSIDQENTHRLIPTKYGDDVLMRIADNKAHLETIIALDCVTNDRLNAENSLLPGITPLELVYGIPFYEIVNAAFCHAQLEGSRFNGPDRGAWYASFEQEGALSEVIFHKTLELAEINYFKEDITYTDYLASFKGDFHDIRDQNSFAKSLDPESYIASQSLASRLFNQNSLGIVYPNVRYKEGTNLICFRPALVNNVRKANTCRLVWDDSEKPKINWISPVP